MSSRTLAEIWGCLLLIAVSVSASTAFAAPPVERGDAKLGRQIYETGVLPDGKLLTATVSGDVPVRGAFVSCAKCHRKSGYGSDEPGKIVPPITGPRLFSARHPMRSEEFRSLFQEPATNDERTLVRVPRVRPAYNLQSLGEALRNGHDPTGRAFGSMKPRYGFGDEDLAHLAAYLRALGAFDPPGIDDDTIHLATILTDEVPQDEQDAFLATINAFVETKNRETARYRARPQMSPHYKRDLIPSYRTWKLHVWRLSGDPAMYPLQLVSQYEQDPVFAVISSLSTRDWTPIHRFCENRDIPCVFPNTSMPASNARGASTLYFDRGIDSEAALLSDAMTRRAKGEASNLRTLVIHDQYELANRFRQSTTSQLPPDVDVAPLELIPWSDELLASFPNRNGLSAIVLCLHEPHLIRTIASVNLPDVPIYVSVSAIGNRSSATPVDSIIGNPASKQVTFLIPHERPDYRQPRSYRIQAWFRARGVKLSHPDLQLKTHFALTVSAYSLGHMLERHSREYFIERIEHETENNLNPGIHRTLSLGPGQRYASPVGCIEVVTGSWARLGHRMADQGDRHDERKATQGYQQVTP